MEIKLKIKVNIKFLETYSTIGDSINPLRMYLIVIIITDHGKQPDS